MTRPSPRLVWCKRRLPFLGGIVAFLFALGTWHAHADAEPPAEASPPPRPHGIAVNATDNTTLLVVADGRIHRLKPGHRSPPGVDADGLRTEDGTPIRGHAGWWKFPNGVTATVREEGESLTIRGMLVWPVGENEFGRNLKRVDGAWGVPIADLAAP